jgi:hypothetical protein
MSQVSTEAFDFIFATKTKLEDRADRLENRIERSQAKLDTLLDNPNASDRKIGRLEGLIAARTGRLVTLEADIAGYDAFPLPQDELVINYNPGDSKFGVSFQESPYDDFFGPGERVKVGVRAWNDNGKKRAQTTQLNLNHPDYTGDKYVLGDSTFTQGSLNLGDYSGYDNALIYVEVGGETLQTLTIV